jgi:hypothetical protein
MHQFAYDQQPRIRFERRGLFRIVTIGRLDQPDCANLFQIRSIESAAHEFARGAPAEVPIFRDKTIAAQRCCTKAKSHTHTSAS